MDISSVNSDLIRGNVTTIILGCLLSADKYGYEILKEIEDKSNSQYVLKQATLYNQLKRLEKQGLVSSYDGDPDDTGGGKRRYYTLTKEGRAYLTKEKNEYEYSRTILDKLVSSDEYDFTVPVPFEASDLRPYSKRDAEEKPKVVYKDKIVEKKVFFDRYGNEVSEEDAASLREKAEQEDEQTRLKDEQLRQQEEETQKVSEQLRLSEEEAKKANEQLKLSEEEARQKEEQLRFHAEEVRRRDEQLRKTEEQLRFHAEEVRRRDEQLRKTEEQLKKSEEDRELVKSMLRRMEEEKLRAEEEKRLAEEEEKRRAEEEKRRAEEEAERKRQEQAKPSQTLEEMFAKLDAESEYKKQEEMRTYEFNSHAEPQEHTYINGYTNQVEQTQRSQTSLKDIFKQLDEREAQIDDKLAKEQEQQIIAQQEAELQAQKQQAQQEQQTVQAYAQTPAQEQFYPAELESKNQVDSKGHFVTSAVVSRQEGGFDYEKDDVNYRDFFVSLQDNKSDVQQGQEKPQQTNDYSDSDIKTRLYAKGFKIRPYDRGNTSEYYTFNFIQSNRLNRDTFLIILAFFVAEVAIMWASLATKVSYTYFLPILLVGSALCLVPTVIYLLNPTRRTRANFNFKLSILNRGMLFIELTVVCILIGFFGLGANVNDIDLILESIVLPMVLLTNLPLSSLIYWLLYRTRKYHTA